MTVSQENKESGAAALSLSAMSQLATLQEYQMKLNGVDPNKSAGVVPAATAAAAAAGCQIQAKALSFPRQGEAGDAYEGQGEASAKDSEPQDTI